MADTQDKSDADNSKEPAKDNTKDDEAHSNTKMSSYIQNIKMSSTNTLSGNEKVGKEEQLLEDSKTVVRFSPFWNQTLASTAPILSTFTSGLTSGYSAILLPQLKAINSPIPGDEVTASWIASIAVLPMAPGCLLSGWMMERFGRRKSLYIVCGPYFIGWILIACAYNLDLMLLGRFLTGLCGGILGPLAPVYIGETTAPKYRGFFLAAVSLAIALGIFVAHVIGTFMTWQWTAVICSFFPILTVVLLCLVPETPTWLISKGRIDAGVKAFSWLRGHGDDANAEIKMIVDKQKNIDSEPKLNWKEELKILKSPVLLKPLFIMIFFFFTCQFAGVNAVAFYSIKIVEKAVGSGINHYLAMLIIDLVRVIMSVVACVVCKQYGRRPLCFISGVFTAVSMVGLGLFLHLTAGQHSNLSWIALTCLTVYICAISIGLVPLPWIMCGEVFPTQVRGLGSGISSAMTFVAFFIVVKTAPGMITSLGEVITFSTYGIIALLGTILMYFILPETKGKSLQEIEEKFKNKKVENSV